MTNIRTDTWWTREVTEAKGFSVGDLVQCTYPWLDGTPKIRIKAGIVLRIRGLDEENLDAIKVVASLPKANEFLFVFDVLWDKDVEERFCNSFVHVVADV